MLTLSQTSPGFYVSHYKSLENTVGKGEIALYEQFLLFQQCFLPFVKTFLPLSSNLKLSSVNSFSFEGLKFVVWERVKETGITSDGFRPISCTIPHNKN